jgi:hypothetical protein
VIDGNLDFLPGYTEDSNAIIDHCNGLILYEDFETAYVVNPATRRWDHVCCDDHDVLRRAYIVFDPTVSPHYELFFMPDLPEKAALPPEEEEDPHNSMEWPPSV